MIRSTVTAMVLGLLVSASACKKGSETSAKQEPAPKAQDTTAAKTDTKTPATSADAIASAGVQAGGIDRAGEGAAGVIANVKGTVEVRRVGETTWTAAKADTQVWAGDQVRTAEESTATIAMADESTIEVAEVSTVAMASRAGTADPGSSAAVLGGLARFTVTPRTPGEGAFRVYTSSGVIVTRGTTYGVGVAASGEARVGVESGSVDVIGVAALDAQPVTVAQSTQVMLGADGKVGSTAAWATDDWGTWRDETDAKIQVGAAVEAHGQALADMNAALVAGYAELESNADSAATFEATAATSAEKGDTAAYTAAQPEFATTIDASFALAGRLEALTWAHAAHGTLATDLYVRHPEAVKAQWDVVAPRVDASVLWPKRFEVTATAYLEPLRTQYYVHHPRGRMHAHLVGITVPEFYAKVEPQPIDAAKVRGKVKGQIWLAPEIAYDAKASARPVWVTAPNANWHAKVKVMPAAPRAKMAWYVRPATLKSTAFLGAKVTGNWQTKLALQPPQPRAALAASWKIPVGTKVKIAAPDMSAAASARAKFKPGMHAGMGMKGDMKAKADAKLDVKAPAVAVPTVKAPDVKVDVKGKANAAANATADVKSKVDGAVKANADVKVKAPEVKIKAPEVKLKGEAKGSFKLGN